MIGAIIGRRYIGEMCKYPYEVDKAPPVQHRLHSFEQVQLQAEKDAFANTCASKLKANDVGNAEQLLGPV